MIPKAVCCISFDSYIKPQPMLEKTLYFSLLAFLLSIRNGSVGFFSDAKLLKKLQLNGFADIFFLYFTLVNTFGFAPKVIDITILFVSDA